MKKLLLLSVVLLFASCQKEVITKSSHSVKMYRNGFKWLYFHNGVYQYTNCFTAQSGDSVRLHSAISVPMNHYAHIVIDNDTVLSHNGFQDTVNLFYVIP